MLRNNHSARGKKRFRSSAQQFQRGRIFLGCVIGRVEKDQVKLDCSGAWPAQERRNAFRMYPKALGQSQPVKICAQHLQRRRDSLNKRDLCGPTAEGLDSGDALMAF